jgi:hypothetical protein
MIGDPAEHISKVVLRVDGVAHAVSISEYIAAARQPPASDPVKR